MRKREEIKKALDLCYKDAIGCKDCPNRFGETDMYTCSGILLMDARALIEADEKLMDANKSQDYESAFFDGFEYGWQVALAEIISKLGRMEWYGGNKQKKCAD